MEGGKTRAESKSGRHSSISSSEEQQTDRCRHVVVQNHPEKLLGMDVYVWTAVRIRHGTQRTELARRPPETDQIPDGYWRLRVKVPEVSTWRMYRHLKYIMSSTLLRIALDILTLEAMAKAYFACLAHLGSVVVLEPHVHICKVRQRKRKDSVMPKQQRMRIHTSTYGVAICLYIQVLGESPLLLEVAAFSRPTTQIHANGIIITSGSAFRVK
ncbi:hypothetical protein QBC37DRAFT_394917 [Rhypophila decipiens]|uniref:Uncharacterized protein n=1 Tax=Rhypophila decipiens TaxID=261697 RepID=A0AAN7BCR1_9PEZI|nr:hypothetical protein QBC37DRAFT_394917 [Rhypophila decipiens]